MSACSSSNKIPDNILPPDKMKFIVWDMMKAGELAAHDTLKNKTINYKTISLNFYQQIFSIYHIDRNSFYESYDYYLRHPDMNNILMDSVSALASREKSKLYMHKFAPL
ncbi:MAG: DUF4296 domain-containing protein [Chitinophagaceae bacterium]